MANGSHFPAAKGPYCTGQNIIPVSVADKRFYALIDTGAECCLINHDRWCAIENDPSVRRSTSVNKDATLECEKENRPLVKSVTGSRLEITRWVTVPVRIGSYTYNQKMGVCRNMA